MHCIRYSAVALAALLTFGCDKQGRPVQEFGLDKLAKGVSSEGDVRTVMGKPETVWEEEDGSRALEYPKGPEGARTWIFIIGKDGTLKDYKQVLTEENFARVKAGMSRDEIRHMPDPTTPRFFNVHFDIGTGRVTRTSMSDATNY